MLITSLISPPMIVMFSLYVTLQSLDDTKLLLMLIEFCANFLILKDYYIFKIQFFQDILVLINFASSLPPYCHIQHNTLENFCYYV